MTVTLAKKNDDDCINDDGTSDVGLAEMYDKDLSMSSIGKYRCEPK